MFRSSDQASCSIWIGRLPKVSPNSSSHYASVTLGRSNCGLLRGFYGCGPDNVFARLSLDETWAGQLRRVTGTLITIPKDYVYLNLICGSALSYIPHCHLSVEISNQCTCLPLVEDTILVVDVDYLGAQSIVVSER